ncbi:hypothetical protein B0H19DRAFT_1086491 [Mycena capillaripes]|nr:hypothetical protein B0H19DRAFT_1086491 [Mycena capillaripes]
MTPSATYSGRIVGLDGTVLRVNLAHISFDGIKAVIGGKWRETRDGSGKKYSPLRWFLRRMLVWGSHSRGIHVNLGWEKPPMAGAAFSRSYGCSSAELGCFQGDWEKRFMFGQ